MSTNTELINFLKTKCEEEIAAKNFEEVIKIYTDLFTLTGDYYFKINVANIYYKVFNDLETATKMYEEYSKYLENDTYFWWQYHEIRMAHQDFYNATYCVYKALEGVKLEDEEDNLNE